MFLAIYSLRVIINFYQQKSKKIISEPYRCLSHSEIMSGMEGIISKIMAGTEGIHRK